MKMAVVEVRNACKKLGKRNDQKIIFNQLNMTVLKGSIYALMGASGCGKTTLLSCIVGMIPLDKGEISSLGYKMNENGIKNAGHRIGYMPQETALIGELTIKETIYYFGKIFQMEYDKLKERYEMLHKLLELPRGDQRVEECSGGQMRRVSFAAAMIHEPDLLILDEPTVGLDPLLREKIWTFMLHITRTSKLAVIITTHYIDEAKQADRCGLMRNGILLAEDTPVNIISRHEVDNLEEAFLKLCMKRGVSEDAVDDSIVQGYDCIDISMDHLEMQERKDNNNQNNVPITTNNNSNIQNQNHNNHSSATSPQQRDCHDNNNLSDVSQATPERKKYNKSTIQALFTKNYLQMKRQPASIVIIFLIPILNVTTFLIGIGGNPIGLKFGIVNDEIYYKDCFNTSLVTTIAHEDSCDLHKVSCRFCQEFNDDIAIKQYYKTFDEAYVDAKTGKIIGFMYFARNYTEALAVVQADERFADEGSLMNGKIDIYMDMSNMQLTYFLQAKINEAYKNYADKLIEDCNLRIAVDKVIIKFQKPIHGGHLKDFKYSSVPPMLLVFSFYLMAVISISSFIVDRKEGFWNRTLVAGVSFEELLLTHTLTYSIIMIIQIIEILFFITCFFDAQTQGNIFGVVYIMIMVGYSGMFSGILLSIEYNRLKDAHEALTGIATVLYNISGGFWPIEGMPIFLQVVSYLFPFTLPSVAMRNIIIKGYSVFHPSVLKASLVLAGWLTCTAILTIKRLDSKKFSRNT